MSEPIAFDGSIKPTRETYDQIQQAYDYFNRALFKGELPNCLITLQRRNRTYGYFSGDRFGLRWASGNQRLIRGAAE